MDIFFVDDAGQTRPSRPGMGPILAVGGIHVPEASISELENKIEALCIETGFPPDEIFKWSPRRGPWMYGNLVREARQEFLIRVLSLAREAEATAIVIIEDTDCGTAPKAETHDIDLIQLLLERAHHELVARGCSGIVIVAQPSGDRTTETKFLANCLETLKCGTDYLKPDRIALSVLSCPPKFIRLLQVADVITACTTAFVAGQDEFSPPIFDTVKQLLVNENGRIGGFGLKIHPDMKYANLYHWLVGDSHFWKHSLGVPLLLKGYPYSAGPTSP
jgi:hypothetical protein